jgi:hypothetical protein
MLKCTKAHLRASLFQKNFFRLANARHKGEGKKGEGRGGEAGGPLGRPPMLPGLLHSSSQSSYKSHAGDTAIATCCICMYMVYQHVVDTWMCPHDRLNPRCMTS